MELTYKSDYLSIRKFNKIDLPSFTVITGTNGAGKTHLLQAIEKGHVSLDNIPINEIKYFDYNSFRLVNTKQNFSSQQILQAQKTAWEFLNGIGKPQNSWIRVGQQIYEKIFINQDLNGQRVDLFDKCGLQSIWDDKGLEKIDERLSKKISDYRSQIGNNVFKNSNFKKNLHHTSLVKVFKKFGKPSHLISEEKFMELFVPSSSSDNHLQCSIGTIFTTYKTNQYNWAHDQGDERDISISELKKAYEDNLEKPWVIINEILSEINQSSENQSVFNFAITNPENEVIKSISRDSYKFIPELIDLDTQENRKFEELSSGEQTLLALVLSIFESKDSYHLPSVLLLDEIDASLHPSMIQVLLSSLQNVIGIKGIKIILITHSPSAIALAPKESVFLINKGAVLEKVVKSSNKKALGVLTEGYATLEEGLTLFNQISQYENIVVTEGLNTGLIKKAFTLFGVNDVGILNGVEHCSGKDQLKILFEFFKQVPNNKNVLFVFDCDVNMGQRKKKNQVDYFILPKNKDNTLVSRGIENMFDENLFDSFCLETKDGEG